MVKTKKEVG